MRILLLGKDGQVGWEIARLYASTPGFTAAGRNQADLADLPGLARFVEEQAPDVIINAAAYTEVDKAETERELAARVNADAPALLAELAADLPAHLIHFSTDYVFDGTKGSPYVESDPTNPVNHYGQTKLDGERRISESGASYWIFRTSWVYSTRRPSFVSNVLDWARDRTSLRVANDQFGSPTWCRSLAVATAGALRKIDLVEDKRTNAPAGTYHVACKGAVSRYDLARQVIGELQVDGTPTDVEPASADEFPLPAVRPAYTALNSGLFEQTFQIELPTWQSALHQAFTKPDHPEGES